MKKKFFLFDAFALIFRAYYSLIKSPRITSTGKNTNAQFGFANTIFEIILKEKPDFIAVCFDVSAPTERHVLYPDYKANRQETPEDILSSVPDIQSLLKAANIHMVSIPGYEADDLMGTLATQAAKKGHQVFLVTADKDFGQLVTEDIVIYKPGSKGNDFEIIGVKEVCDKWRIQKTHQVIDVLALMGDAVDNIPGVQGIGERTASKLLQEFETVENIIAQADAIKGSLGDKVRAGKDMALLSKKLATIITAAPIDFDEHVFAEQPVNQVALQQVFHDLEFKSLAKRLLDDPTPKNDAHKSAGSVQQMSLFASAKNTATLSVQDPLSVEPLVDDTQVQNNDSFISNYKNSHQVPHQYNLVNTPDAVASLIENLSAYQEIVVDTETTGLNPYICELVGFSFAVQPHEAYYVHCPLDWTATQALLNLFNPLWCNTQITWIGHNLKFDLLVLKQYEVHFAGKLYDTMLAQYVVDADSKKSMDVLSKQYLQYEPIAITTLIGKEGKDQLSMRSVTVEDITAYAAEDADVTLQLKHAIAPLVLLNKVDGVLDTIELPLLPVLVDMEFEGINLEVQFLKEYATVVEKDLQLLTTQIYEHAGTEFNIASPKQLGDVLFDKLQIDPAAKKTKTGQYATGEDVLQKLSAKHPIIATILEYRELAKLLSTYILSLPELVNSKTGRLHTSFSQAVAVTGRLSSQNPNLQNIPIRTTRGKEIRKAFVARSPEHVLICADYSQIELRIIAALSKDKNMCAAFLEAKDVHTLTATKIFKVPEADVTKEQRYKAKSVNFGIIYGQGAFGLSENLGISRSEAKLIIDSYKQEFQGIDQYMTEVIAFAKKNGFVETLLGRKRWLRDIDSRNQTVRSFAERNAINAPIQGTAADMIKLAMISIFNECKRQNLKTKMVLQVHDELIFDTPIAEVEIVKPIIKTMMCQALPLPNNIPVEVQIGVGANWLIAHE
ncbi:MAG: DNA polymerase I [Phycisphaerales bacterium]|nr:DNA polymerase I [Phycisphaerales bacterium]